ncbi:MAG: nucleotide-binding universal stress UspA family protein [Natronomonas sp.]|jgi:nucleotide-binding universal stress UspA family protein
MGKRYVVAFDGSEASRSALTYALESPAADAVTALCVVPSQIDSDLTPNVPVMPDRSREQDVDSERMAELVVEMAAQLAAEHADGIETRIEHGSPPDVIAEIGGGDDIDHVVVGSPVPEHGPGPVVERLVEECPETLTLVRRQTESA